VASVPDGHILVGPSAEAGIAKEDTRLVTTDQMGICSRQLLPFKIAAPAK
jgi:hypothetical protein